MTNSVAELEVVCGTYEAFVVGFQLFGECSNGGRTKVDGSPTCDRSADLSQYRVTTSFADQAHSSIVRSVDCDGDIVVSGGCDEVLKAFNMASRREVCHVTHHAATVTAVRVYDNGTRLLSGDSDGVLLITAAGGSWPVLRRLAPPRSSTSGAVTALAVHPSGRLALSCSSASRQLITWDLRGGSIAFRTRLATQIDFLEWSPEGTVFAVGVAGACDVYGLATGAPVCRALRPCHKRVTCASFVSDNIVVVADETGEVLMADVKDPRATVLDEREEYGMRWRVMECRVRAMRSVRRCVNVAWLVCMAASGQIAVWSVDFSCVDSSADVATRPLLLVRHDTGCRLTCLTVHVPRDKRYHCPTDSEAVCDDSGVVEPVTDVTETPNNVVVPRKKKVSRKMIGNDAGEANGGNKMKLLRVDRKKKGLKTSGKKVALFKPAVKTNGGLVSKKTAKKQRLKTKASRKLINNSGCVDVSQ